MDNEFVIDTLINTDDAENSIDSLNEKFKELEKDVDLLTDKEKESIRQSTKAVNEQKAVFDEQRKKVQELALALERMKTQGTPTEEYEKLNKKLEEAEKRLKIANDLKKSFEEMGGNKSSEEFAEIVKRVEETEKRFNSLKAKREALEKSGKAYNKDNIGANTTQLETELNDAEKKLSELEEKLKDKSIILRLKLDTAQAKVDAENEGEKTGKRFGDSFIIRFNRALLGLGKNISTKAIKGLTEHFKKNNDQVKHGIKNMLRYTLGIRSVFALVRKLRTALTEGFKNLAQFNNGNNETNKSISLLKNSLTQLKNTFATAFAPLLNVVAPALNNFINLLIEGVNAIGMMIARLNGMTTFTKAKKLTDDYTKSLNKAKNSLYAFDELNTKTESGGTNPNNMFEVVGIDEQISSFTDKLKEAFNDGDMTDIGRNVASKIVEGLKSIDFSGAREFAGLLGTNLATFINGMTISTLGEDLGRKLGEGIMVAVQFLNSFMKKLNFREIGDQLGRFINGLADEIDFSMLGENLGEYLKGALEFMCGVVQEIDWYELGEDVREFLTGIDWSGIISDMFELMGSVLGGLASFLWGIIEEQWNDLVDWWYDTAFEDGEFSMEGLLNGILEKLKDIGAWIKEHIFQPFIDGFKEAFDIHSPSKVMEEMGEYIVQGLFDGITGLIDTVVEIWENFKEDVLEIFDNLWGGLKKILNTIINGVESMINGVINGINAMINALNKLSFDVPDWIPEIGGKTFGFNIPNVSKVNLPRLATGTVVPRTAREFTAILGDNNQETEVVSPLSTMKEAFLEALSESGADRTPDVYISADGDLDALIRLLNLKIDKEKSRKGVNFRKVVTT